MPDYSKCIIYKLCCNDPSIEEIYIGSTCNFTNRKRHHKSNCHNPNHKHYTCKAYHFIREHGGWQNWSMVMIHELAVESKLQKGKLERQYIDQLKPSLNSYLPTRTDKQWREDNKETLSKKRKQNYNFNKEEILNQQKIYRDTNKEQIREKANQKFECECGGKFTNRGKSQHLKTKKHQNFINA